MLSAFLAFAMPCAFLFWARAVFSKHKAESVAWQFFSFSQNRAFLGQIMYSLGKELKNRFLVIQARRCKQKGLFSIYFLNLSA